MKDPAVILVVDDEYSNRLLLEEILSDYTVITAESGHAMWRVLETVKPSLILMDVMMPEEDGFTLTSRLKSIEKFADIPVIFVSARVAGEDVGRGFDLGGHDYIKKPFNQYEVEGRVRTVLASNRHTQSLQRKIFTSDVILSTMADGVITCDTAGTITYLNKAMDNLLFIQSTSMIGIKVDEIFGNPFISQYLQKNTDRFTAEMNMRRGMSQLPVLVSASPLFEQDELLAGWVIVIHDNSLQKQSEMRLVEARDKAEQADRLKSAFLANMSHEIRTPMNSIVGFSELLEDELISHEERLEYLSIIKKNSDKLLQFFDNLLDISLIEAGQVQINKSIFYVNYVLDELLSTFVVYKKRQKKDNLELRFSRGQSDNSFHILTDSYRFQQILSNLLVNAIKFTNQGYVEFGYIMQPIEHGKVPTLQFYVEDTGVGIPEDKTSFIFDRFGQVENDAMRTVQGSGLGLAISKNLCELLGGEISVQSTLGVGSRFIFTIPIK